MDIGMFVHAGSIGVIIEMVNTERLQSGNCLGGTFRQIIYEQDIGILGNGE